MAGVAEDSVDDHDGFAPNGKPRQNSIRPTVASGVRPAATDSGSTSHTRSHSRRADQAVPRTRGYLIRAEPVELKICPMPDTVRAELFSQFRSGAGRIRTDGLTDLHSADLRHSVVIACDVLSQVSVLSGDLRRSCWTAAICHIRVGKRGHYRAATGAISGAACGSLRGSGKPRLRYPGARFFNEDDRTPVWMSW
jgi:hypothetical protein